MKIGRIDYINLLPFDVFIKKQPLMNASKKFMECRKSYPSRLNQEFKRRRIEASFISAIAGKGKKVTKAGIVARGSVLSVIAIPDEEGKDYQSATSNALLEVLGVKGRVLIGDRALQYYSQGKEHIDLGEEWFKRHRLPFVFGRFCYNARASLYEMLANRFVQKPIKIPFYILDKYARERSVSRDLIKRYLKNHIFYKVDKKECLSLNKFYFEERMSCLYKISKSKKFK
ncbi:menaquinone biosynthesis protein [Helicobacter monodelphidis]|uniref:MqnA/MqnD/SBP family protein n=1 Tax=Helicobacter sp. 15-1451 TaxID=2004995 RepID=UPI000DCDB08B|nr:MqnA/MqnD/SBP family protein [Helicobacter sp. 15-1451]RAX57185.1 menaquinone biosynthesis protein [Helicobacter sp. 15-1451]